jgi:N-acetylglucosamine-6-phosphate deacetylase
VGTDDSGFMLQGREIWRDGDTLHGTDGVLAGSTLTMAGAVRGMMTQSGIPLAAAAAMAAATPAAFLGQSDVRGTIAAGMRADLVLVDDDLTVHETWIGGESSAALTDQRAII